MNKFQTVTRKGIMLVASLVLAVGAGTLGIFLILLSVFQLGAVSSIALSMIVLVISSLGAGYFATSYLLTPTKSMYSTVHHLLDDQPIGERHDESGFGAELVDDSIQVITKFIQQQQSHSEQASSKAHLASGILDQIVHPVFAVNHEKQITYLNDAGSSLLEKDKADIKGHPIEEQINLTIKNKPFLGDWIDKTQSSVVNKQQVWTDTIFMALNRQLYHFDVYANFVSNAEGEVETVIAMVDRTSEHEFDDIKLDFASMAAHELRGPITVIRGYVDVFEDELSDVLTDEQKRFLEKLKVSGAQLSGFISNILHVAKIDKGSLQLQFEKHNWEAFVRQTLSDLQLRAHAHGKDLKINIAKDLPPVAIDPVSIAEVINNFVDNAIKYSRNSKEIIVDAHLNGEGFVETTVQDFGVGIPANLMDKLFTKFYRSHRTRTQFGGSGLGLYLSKAIIDGHKGDIWAKSEEGEGSTFGFSIPPYDQVIDKLESDENNNITRGRHGWIKNHSLYRK